MAKPNYGFEKRQREIARKKKQDEKRLRKQDKPAAPEELTPATGNATEKDGEVEGGQH